MTIIAVEGLRRSWSINRSILKLARVIKAPFKTLSKNKTENCVTIYLRLAEHLDAETVIKKLNSATFLNGMVLHAYIPDNLPPDLPLDGKKIPSQIQRQLKIHDHPGSSELLCAVHNEIMAEMQYKYIGLYNLSSKMDHKLLEEIAQSVFERLKCLINTNSETEYSCLSLTENYRVVHPHSDDLQLIMSTLHSIQTSAGEPLSHLQEKDLLVENPGARSVDNIPFATLTQITDKLYKQITRNVSRHVNSLNANIDPHVDDEEEIARKKVRREIKNIAPYLHMIIRQVITYEFVPEAPPSVTFSSFRIYGVPFLPPNETIRPFLEEYHASRVVRSKDMYNLVTFIVPLSFYGSLMAMDGVFVGGVQLVIRPKDKPTYNVSEELKAKMREIKLKVSLKNVGKKT